VFAQSGFVRESFGALGAAEHNVVMLVHVAFIVSSHGEAAATDVAVVGRLVEMLGITMQLQALYCGKGDTAQVARQLAGLSLCLALKHWAKMPTRKSFATQAAFILEACLAFETG
jgi:hypothetical protein